MAEILTLADVDDPAGARAVEVLEGGGVVVLARSPFAVRPDERRFLDPAVSNGKSKNISFDPATGVLSGDETTGETRSELTAMVRRFSDAAEAALGRLAPGYVSALERKRTSFRPAPIENRALSPRKDDRLLHIDAFPANPVQGRRILRVFANVNDAGEDRIWNVGDAGFPAFAAAFKSRLKPQGGGAWRERLGLTKGHRTAYDAAMLQLHDAAKFDHAWQASTSKQRLAFAPGSMWIVYTDAVLHAALAGQHALEQTFLLPADAMMAPTTAPLRVLESITGRALI